MPAGNDMYGSQVSMRRVRTGTQVRYGQTVSLGPAIDDAGVVQRVADDRVLGAQERLK